jgi:biopolymer transport protein ExbD
MSRSPLLLVGVIAAYGLAACDEPPKSTGATSSAKPVVTTAASTATPAELPKPTTMPELTVDSDGPYLGGQRVNLAEATGPEKLTKIVKDLPINGKPVTLVANKHAKVSAVAAVVTALGEAGAPKVTVKTDGRSDLPKTLELTPESRLSSPPGCSVVATVLKDLSTALWPFKGGVSAHKQRKGLAGPDLSHTGEQLEKDLGACDSTTAFFSGDDSVGWESVFNLAGTVLTSDKKKRLDTLVLLREEPVAGRAVTLGKH